MKKLEVEVYFKCGKCEIKGILVCEVVMSTYHGREGVGGGRRRFDFDDKM